ncbi:hypothetical protein [Fredinandcohnia sp. 179-A 10B2 NHS]|uniref:hypothetical protein n=1 Tax=Fredinandcohnia sp. 179-A 10B2 NHS TaxID=3235176 RepID=UPI0039A055A4
MTNQLRVGMEKMRSYYTEQLVAAGVVKDNETDSYTLTELENLFKLTFQLKK